MQNRLDNMNSSASFFGNWALFGGYMLYNRQCRLLILLAVVIHLVGLYLVLSRQVDFLFNDASHRIGPATDFRSMYTAGVAWHNGEQLYGQGPGGGYRYHPFAAMTFYGWLSNLPLKAAFFVWIGISELLLLAALIALRRLIPNPHHYSYWMLGISLATPLYLELYMGNATLAAVALLISAYDQEARNRSFTATSIFIISCLVKPIGVILLPLMVIKKRVLPALATVGILMILAMPYAAAEPQNFTRMILFNFTDQINSPGFLVHAGNQGLHALLTRIGAWQTDIALTSLHSIDQLSPFFSHFLFIWPFLLLALAILLAWRYRTSNNAALMLGLFLLTFVCAYREVWEHSYVAVVLAALLLWGAGTVNRKAIAVGFIIVALPTAFVLYDISYTGSRMHDPDWEWSTMVSLLHHATKPTGAIILLSAAVVGVISSGRRSKNIQKASHDQSVLRTITGKVTPGL